MKSGLFISYRREDSAGHVGRLYDALAHRFGADRIFMDIDHIQAGQDFVDVLNRAVAECRILLVVIGPNWLMASGKSGRRLDDPADFVRLEIAAGLNRNIHVIPVLVHGATMPSPSELPSDLASLSRRQAFEIADIRWKRDVEVLLRSIAALLPPTTGIRTRVAAAVVAAVLLIAAIAVWFFREPPPQSQASQKLESPQPSNPSPPEPRVTAATTAGRVLFDDDFYSEHRLTTPQTRYNAAPSYCRTEYVQDGFLVEAVSAGEACEYVLYDAPVMPNRIRIEISLRLRHFPMELLKAGGPSAYGLRFLEAKPEDPDSPLTYRAAIVGVDSFNVVESQRMSSKILLDPGTAAENFIRAGERGTNTFVVEVDARSLKWELNGRAIGSAPIRERLSGAITTFVQGKGIQVVYRNLRIEELRN